MTIATDARRVVRALPTPRVPGADASRRGSPMANASAVRIRRRRAARTPASPCRSGATPSQSTAGWRALFPRIDFRLHRLTAPLPCRPQSRDAMNEPVPSVPRKARTGTALDGIERGTRASALPARGFPSLARFPAKRRSAAFSPSRIAPHPDFPPVPAQPGAEGRFPTVDTRSASSEEDFPCRRIFFVPSENAGVFSVSQIRFRAARSLTTPSLCVPVVRHRVVSSSSQS